MVTTGLNRKKIFWVCTFIIYLIFISAAITMADDDVKDDNHAHKEVNKKHKEEMGINKTATNQHIMMETHRKGMRGHKRGDKSFSASQYGYSKHSGTMFSHIKRNADVIGLSEEQKEKISKIELETKKQKIKLEAQKEIVQLDFKSLMNSKDFNKEKLLEKIKEKSKLISEITKTKLTGVVNILSFLTAKQRETIRSMHGDLDFF